MFLGLTDQHQDRLVRQRYESEDSDLHPIVNNKIHIKPATPWNTKKALKKPGLRIRIHFIRIRIQHFRLNTDPDPIRIRIRIQGFNDQKLEKKLQLNKKLIFFWIKNYYFSI